MIWVHTCPWHPQRCSSFHSGAEKTGVPSPINTIAIPNSHLEISEWEMKIPSSSSCFGENKNKIKHQHRMQFSFCDERAGDQDDSRWPQVCLWRVHRQCEALLSEFILNRQAVVQLLAFTQRGIGTAHPFHILITLQAVQHTLPSAPQPCLFWQALCKFYLLKHNWINIVNY